MFNVSPNNKTEKLTAAKPLKREPAIESLSLNEFGIPRTQNKKETMKKHKYFFSVLFLTFGMSPIISGQTYKNYDSISIFQPKMNKK